MERVNSKTSLIRPNPLPAEVSSNSEHNFRHSCATHLLRGKADIRQIQKLLGHRRLSSTEIYTHVEISDLEEVLQRCHPRGRKVTSDK